MSVSAINSNTNIEYYQEVEKKEEINVPFSLQESVENSEEKVVEAQKRKDMKFEDVMNLIKSGKGRQIPVVNQIVSSKSEEDGEIYRNFFTDNRITCQSAVGKTIWEVRIENKEQRETIAEFFKNYKPNNEYFKEYYSGEEFKKMMSKDFWLELFHKKEKIENEK